MASLAVSSKKYVLFRKQVLVEEEAVSASVFRHRDDEIRCNGEEPAESISTSLFKASRSYTGSLSGMYAHKGLPHTA